MTEATGTTTTIYSGNYIYQNNALQMINQPEGYLEPNFTSSEVVTSSEVEMDYGYRLKVGAQRKSRLCGNYPSVARQVLGNIRLTFIDFDHNGSIALSEITEENNYYPFGLKHQGYNFVVSSNTNAVANKFKYNGKVGAQRKSRSFGKLNDELGLDLYDYGARFYDAALGRWHVIDPLAEKYYSWSTYNYAVNSPIRFLDPDGKSVGDYDRFPYEESMQGKEYERKQQEQRERAHQFAAEGDGKGDGKEGAVKKGGTTPSNITMKYDKNGKMIGYTSTPAASLKGGDHHGILNNVVQTAGFLSGGLGVVQIGMLEYRSSLSISAKIGTFSKFSSAYRSIGTPGKILGGALTYIGAPLSIGLDYNAMQNRQISGDLFAYRTTGILSSVAATYLIGATFGNPWGLVGGALIGAGFVAVESIYKSAQYLWNESLIQKSNFENAIKSGKWYPGRK